MSSDFRTEISNPKFIFYKSKFKFLKWKFNSKNQWSMNQKWKKKIHLFFNPSFEFKKKNFFFEKLKKKEENVTKVKWVGVGK